MQSRATSPATSRDVMLVLLTMAAGCVDAVGFLGLGQVLTAAMTGNTVLLGLAVGQANAAAAIRSTVALVGFVVGAVLGAAIVRRGPRDAVWPPAVTAALAFELAMLAALAVGWHLIGEIVDEEPIYLDLLIATAGLAMGLQSVAAHRVGVAGVPTTIVTGTLVNSATRLVGWLHSRRGGLDHAPDARREWSGHPAYLTLVWLSYGAGAAAAGAVSVWWPVAFASSAAGEIRWPTVALLLPIAIVSAVIATATIRYRHKRVAGP